jgi:hypothetical protein
MISAVHIFRLRPLCLIIAGALLSACGGSSDSPSAPVAPAEPALTLLGESMVSPSFMPGGIAVDVAGTIYVGNRSAKQVLVSSNVMSPIEIVKVSQGGTVSAFINRSSNYIQAGGEAHFGFGRVAQLAFDNASQTLYALEGGGSEERLHTSSIRPISASGVVDTFVLDIAQTHANCAPLPTRIAQPSSALAVGPGGSLHAYGSSLIAPESMPATGSYSLGFDSWQVFDAKGRARIVYSQESGTSTPGTIDSNRAHAYTYPADLSSTEGRFGRNEGGLALDDAGNAYIADTGRHAIVKITPAGVASILAGTPTQAGSADGNGKAARFNAPTQLVLDKASNVFVLDSGNATVRRITPAGAVSTVLGVVGQSQTRTGALPGGLGAPKGLAIDTAGRLYVTVDKGVVRAQLP